METIVSRLPDGNYCQSTGWSLLGSNVDCNGVVLFMPSLPASANRHLLPLPLCRGPVPPQSAQARPRPTLEDGGGGRAGSCKGAGIGAAAGIWGVRACSYMAVVMQQAHARSRARSGRHRPAVKRLRVPAHVTVQRCSARARHCPACAVPRRGRCMRWCRAFRCVCSHPSIWYACPSLICSV